mgnify:FL=1
MKKERAAKVGKAAEDCKRTHEKRDEVAEFESPFSLSEKGGKEKNRLFLSIVKKNFWLIFWSTIVFIIKNSPIWIIPIISSNIINIITDYLGGTMAYEEVIRLCIINGAVFVGCLIQNIPTHEIWAKLVSKLNRNIDANIRSAVVRKLQRLSITYHKEMETGRIESKFLHDVDNITALFTVLTNGLIPAIISVIVSVAISVVKSGTVSLFFLAIIPLNVILAMLFRKKMAKNSKNFRQSNEAVSKRLSNILEMLVVTKAHGLEEKEYDDFHKEIESMKKRGRDLDTVNAYFGSTSWVLANILNGVCLAFCAYMAFTGSITVGDVVLYQSLFGAINSNVLNIINIMPNIVNGKESLCSVSELMRAGDMEISDKGKVLTELMGEVKFDHVYYGYPKTDDYTIKDFSLDVKKGECIAVVGSSGSGKTTLMNMIIGFLLPVKGAVYIDGNSMADINLDSYRHFISVVPQNSILFAGTVRENITYGLDGYTEEELMNAVKKANLEEVINELPDGIDTFIGEHGGRLSGGQKQRITIARALIRNPKILILDEATSALDNVSEYHVQKAISGLIKGRTTFIVAHRLSTIRDADRIVVMENGEAVEVGSYEELMAAKGAFYKLKELNDLNYKEAEEGLNAV